MDNFDMSNFGSQDLNEPIPLDKDFDKPIPFDDVGMSESGVSHSPLDLGGGGAVKVPKTEVPKPVAQKPVAQKPVARKPVAQKPGGQIASGDRIAGVKTFFTKLHPGAMNFRKDLLYKAAPRRYEFP
ncbi:MAG: hypothetical protein ACYS9C_16875 [Planctomycetota bacterium]|jgi:hypothetical protein